MAAPQTFVIIGAGLAGTRAATTLRKEGFAGRIVLLSDETHRPYDRVTLSKHYLTGRPGFHGLFLHDEAFYADQRIELHLGVTVDRLDIRRHDVVLTSGKRFRYDALLLATGAEPNQWRGRGSDLDGVHYVRTLADADRLRAALEQTARTGGQVAVIGTGWIGCEVAAAARQLGPPVSLIGRTPLPLARQVGPGIAGYFRSVHEHHGVELLLGSDVTALTGAGSVQDVVLADGRVVPADVVIVGIGARPRTELAVAAGLAVDDGIVTDALLRTSEPDVFAAGDVASVPNAALGRRTRLEHFATAIVEGAAAARSMLGAGEPYSQIPFFFSDQYQIWMECTGDPAAGDDYVVRALPGTDPNVASGNGSGPATGSEEFLAFWLRDGRLAAGMNVNVKGVPDRIAALIADGRPVDRAALADPAVPLEDVVAHG